MQLPEDMAKNFLWMQAPSIHRLLQAIPDAATSIWFVGGCVRDALLGLTPHEIDFATRYTPQEIEGFLKTTGLGCIPTGLRHGTVTALVDGIPYEITTLRKDVETDGRHAVVAFTTDRHEDAARRDLTFNALYLSIDGELFDPFMGWEDLKAGRVRFIGNARDRIQEDYLRLLRFFRFYQRYGQTVPDAATMQAIIELAPGLQRISGERLHQEIWKILEHPDPLKALDLMAQTPLLEILFGQTRVPEPLRHLLDLETQHHVPTTLLTRLYLLLYQGTAQLDAILNRFKCANDEKKWMHQMDVFLKKAPTAFNQASLYHIGAPFCQQAALLWMALTPSADLSPFLEKARTWEKPLFPLTGKDLKANGLTESPRLGQILGQTETWWIEQNFQPDHAACLQHALALTSQP